LKLLRLVYLSVFLFLSFGLFALPFDMIPVGDPILEDLRYLSLESGRPFLSLPPPLAPAEVEQFLDSLDESLLSEPAREAYYRARKRLAPEARLSLTSDHFSVFFNINSTLEARVRFNRDIDWYPQYPKIAPMISVPLRFFFGNIVQLYFEPLVSVNPPHYQSADIFGINMHYNTENLDPTLPHRAFIAAGGPWWNFQLGRDRLFWGTGHTGSLTFADNSAYFEYARLSLFSKIFKYSLIVNQMPLRITNDLYDPSSLDPPSTWDLDSITHTTQRNFYLHRLDFSFFNRITISAMEGVMVGNSPLEIRYLNPFIIFHSFFSWVDYDEWPETAKVHGSGSMNGSFFSVEVNWNIIKSLSVYGQFVMNEFALKSELENPDQPPNAMGYMAGLNYTHSFNTWGSAFFLEFVYTDPFLYVLSSPFASFIQMCKVGPAEAHVQYRFIGYPRDTISLTLGGRFFKGDTLSFSGSFSWLSKGEHDKNGLEWDWEKSQAAREAKTPSGTAENSFIISLGAQWKPLPYLGINGSLTGIVAHNNNHNSGSDKIGGQASLSVSFQY